MVTPFEIIKQLDGLSITEASRVLESAIRLLTSTQLVSAKSPILEAQERQAKSVCPEEALTSHE